MVASNLHVLNIAKIKEKVGDRWDRLSKVIQMNIETIIDRHLQKGDEVMRRSELNYVIVFANADKQETSQRLKTISHEVIEKVFGTDALLEGFEIQSTAAPLTSSQNPEMTLAEVFASLDNSDWRETYSRARMELEANDMLPATTVLSDAKKTIAYTKKMLAGVTDDADINDFINILNKLSPALQETQDACRQLVSTGTSFTGTSDGASELANILKITETYSQAIAKLKNQAEKYKETIEVTTNDQHEAEQNTNQELVIDPDAYFEEKQKAADRLDPLSQVKFIYSSVWDIPEEKISRFRCKISYKDVSKPFSVERLFSGHNLENAHFQMDCAVLRQVIRDVVATATEGEPITLIAPIKFSSVSSARNRSIVVQTLNSLPETLRPRLQLEIINIDANTWSSRISEAVGFLKNQCGAISLRLPPRYRYLNDLKQAGVYAVGHDVAELKLREVSIFGELENLCKMADLTQIKIFLSGVNSMSLVSGAIGAGVTYMDGSIVKSPPKPVAKKLTLSDLYTSQFRTVA
ncbi:hypothetical protein [Kordiimonas sp.]|uniref:hypothetical protein n=1 Tax=Kordiimonas sp. TaxID=1970157 RepID=UPI003A9426F8